jgi:hypothetical protein
VSATSTFQQHWWLVLMLFTLTHCRRQCMGVNREHGAPNASPLLKLQIIRSIACNIVKHRDFYPTKEVLLKHALGYMGMLDEFKGAFWAALLRSIMSAVCSPS